VVIISLLTILFQGLPGISTLRLMRAFRVFRLFKRLASLRKILKALENAVPGCSNAFSIVILVNAIYSILGVEFFKDSDSAAYFKNFSVAMFTMFQVMTGDSWSEAIARPIIDQYPWAAIYFITYILIVGIVLINVVIAVLLEKMVDSGEEEEEELSSSDEEVEEVEDEEPEPEYSLPVASDASDLDGKEMDGKETISSPVSPVKPSDSGSDDDKTQTQPPVAIEMKAVYNPLNDIHIQPGNNGPVRPRVRPRVRNADSKTSMFFGGGTKAKAKEDQKRVVEAEVMQSHLILTLIEKVDALGTSLAKVRDDLSEVKASQGKQKRPTNHR